MSKLLLSLSAFSLLFGLKTATHREHNLCPAPVPVNLPADTIIPEINHAQALALQKVLDKTVDGKKVFGTSFAVKHNGAVWKGAAGNITTDQPYFIASTTKLFATAIIMHLRSKNELNLDDKISRYLNDSIMQGLHVYKGVDYSSEITIRHLLAHTSGLPDYFQTQGPNGSSLEAELIRGNDQFWTFEQAIARSKTMQPKFKPGAKGKAHYSDTNFQLLGKIIEVITQKSFSENCDKLIIKPLQLKNTYLYADANDMRPASLKYKKGDLRIPKAMTSFGPDGGMVSTSADMLAFIEAFFTGKFFPTAYLAEMQDWNKIFFPMRAGTGIHRFKLPWIFNPFGTIPEFIGHSGLSGALAYYAPDKNLFIVGTVNQVANPDQSFRTMIKLTQKVLR
jgi:D-alanyl-D-alanine carboxypeptidase